MEVATSDLLLPLIENSFEIYYGVLWNKFYKVWNMSGMSIRFTC